MPRMGVSEMTPLMAGNSGKMNDCAWIMTVLAYSLTLYLPQNLNIN